MVYTLVLTVMTITGTHVFDLKSRTFETREQCELYGVDTQRVLNDSKYTINTKFRCRGRGIPM